MAKLALDDQRVGKQDRAYKFAVGIYRFAAPTLSEWHMEAVHFDEGFFVCTKSALDKALRDPQGRCFDCDMRNDRPRQEAVVAAAFYRINDHGHAQYALNDPNLFHFEYLRLAGDRLSNLVTQIRAQGGRLDVRHHDILAQCTDANWQKVQFQVQWHEPAWWLKPECKTQFEALWADQGVKEEQLEAFLGSRMSFEQRIQHATVQAQKKQGAQAGLAAPNAFAGVAGFTAPMGGAPAWGASAGLAAPQAPASPLLSAPPVISAPAPLVAPAPALTTPFGPSGAAAVPAASKTSASQAELDALLAQMQAGK